MAVVPDVRDVVLAVSPLGSLEPSPAIAAAAWRGGGTGVLDLGAGGYWARAAVGQAAGVPLGVRVTPGCAARPEDVRAAGQGQVVLALLAADAPWDIAGTATWCRVLAEVTSQEEAAAAVAAGAHGLVARGMESGGPVGELSTFVLLQQLLAGDGPGVPVWAAGGIGPLTAAACVAAGAAGVVLDIQLGLMPEADLPGEVRRLLARLDGAETVVAGGRRGVRVTGSPVRLAGPRDTSTELLPAGQDGYLASAFAKRWPDTAAAVRGVRAAIAAGAAALADGAAGLIGEGGPLAQSLGVRIPVAQGPMTRVSDQPGFAAAIAADGAMPFVALSLADGEQSRQLLTETAAEVGGRPWGAGMLGFAPEELRAAQLEAVREVRPDWMIVAGGRPAQAAALEQDGIVTFLHVPSPGLLAQFLRAGARRFVFEGAECGGHIGPRASFPLWETQLEVIGEFLDEDPAAAGDVQVLFAGGIHDARSAAMVAVLAAPLAARGVRPGILMGTSYLFTAEAVEHGAILPQFQELALAAAGTALLETAPGHVTRGLRTAYVDEFVRQRAELEAAGTDGREIWARLELLNTGRLRLATKGVEHGGAVIDSATQAAEGLYMAGQVAVLRDQVTTIAGLHEEVTTGTAEFLAGRADALRSLAPATAAGEGAADAAGPLDVAIVGLAGMFASTSDADGFWDLVLSGRDSFAEVPAERWDPEIYYTSELAGSQVGRRTVSKWGGFLEPAVIDPIRYGIPPTALGSIDPSQLLSLEIADQALQDAGYPYDEAGADHSRTGVIFAAASGSDTGGALALRSVLPGYLGELPAELEEQLPTFTEDTFPGSLPNVVAGRIANRLDLGGANFTVDAACAASMAALDAACKQLSTGAADLMLCGAVDLHNSISDYLMFGSVFALSPSGRVATFDEAADGTALGEGVGCVVLKRLADAERDGDRVYAVIKGIGAASDGRARSLTAPRIEGQIRAMDRAYRQAAISPAHVGVVEAHGTGTVLGDQVELDSLTSVFADAGAGPASVVLGSVKSQVGHAKCAAGLAGLIKAALSVYHGIQPPTCNLSHPNQAWDPAASPFTFLHQPRPWIAAAADRVAGVSAFGFGGTNFHAVLAGHAPAEPPRHARSQWPAELLCFRGASPEAARAAIGDAAAELALARARPGGVRLRDLAARAAAAAETTPGPVRVAIVARDPAELAALLDRALAGEHDPAAGLIQPPEPLPAAGSGPDGSAADRPSGRPQVAFLFPGQGSQRAGALGELFVGFPELRHYLAIGQPWAPVMFPSAAFSPEAERTQAAALRDTRVAQPALGIWGLTAAHLLGRVGVHPDMAGGHSYGELAALAVAGAVDPVTLLDLSHARGAAMTAAAGADPGTMAAVAGTAPEVTAALDGAGLDGQVTLANLNAPGQVVISGLTPVVDAAVTALKAAGLTARRLPVACAFHSPVVAAASDSFAAELAGRPMAVPRIPVWSNVTATPHAADPDQIRAGLAAQISAPVRFAEQIEAMYAAGARVFVEAGPGQVLTGLVRATLGDRPHLALPCDPPGQGLRGFLTTLAQLACAQVPVNLAWLFQGRAAPPPATTDKRPRWLVNGQLVRDGNGAVPAGGLIPARLIKELPMTASNGYSSNGPPADIDATLTEFLRTSRDIITAQRDVMLAFLGGAPGGRLVWQDQAGGGGHAVPMTGAAVAVPVAPEAPAPADLVAPATTAAPPGAAAEPVLEADIIALISDRTGYPPDLIEPDLDLEADLSIDSIKRAEIAGIVALRLGIASAEDIDEATFEDLVRARSVRGMMTWIDTASYGSRRGAPEPVAAAAAPPEAAAAGPVAGQEEAALTGVTPLRMVSQLVAMDSPAAPPELPGGMRVVITGTGPVATELATRLGALGATVMSGTLDTVTADDVRDADGVVFLDGLEPEPATALPPAIFPLLKTTVTSQDATPTGQRRVLAAGYAVTPEAGGLAGLLRTASTEYPALQARYVELDQPAPPAQAAERLLTELLDGPAGPAVTYAGDARFRRELAREDLDPAVSGAADALAAGLGADSVVVLIGGARGITASFARALAAASPCRIELVGRTQLATDPEPPEIAAAPDAIALRAALAGQGMRVPAEIASASREILARREVRATMTELSDLGAQVRYHCADACDEEAISQVLKLAHEDYGRIDGVVYGAGVIEDRLIADKDPESFARVFHTKVGGAQVVLELIREQNLAPAFTVLYGSIAAAYGSRGQADYAAANDALEALGARWAGVTGHRCLTVHWGPWSPAGSHPGMVTPELGREYARRGIGLIDPRQGALALLGELARGDRDRTAVTYTGTVPDAR